MTDFDAPLRVLQVGPQASGPHSRGGIATVMSLILEHPDPRVVQRHVPTYGDGSRAKKLGLGVSGIARVAGLVATRQVDVVHAHMSFKGSVLRKGLVLRIAQAAGVPTVLHAHSHGFTRWLSGLPAPTRWAIRTLLHADRWLVLGGRWATEYSEHLRIDPERVSVLHNPTVPAPRGLAGAQTWRAMGPRVESVEPVRALFLGRLGERKGCFDLVEAIAALPDDVRSRLRLIMAGDGDEEGVRAAARRAGIDHLVSFPGWIDAEQRAALLAGADMLLLPSHQEGLPMAVLEGMAAGRLVITTPVGGIPEVITDEENGLLVPPVRCRS